MTISIGNDHAGTEYKFAIVSYLESKGYTVNNYGTDNSDSVDYPDFVHPVAKDVDASKVDFGILICGSANGVAMTANKYQNVRAGICWMNEITELLKVVDIKIELIKFHCLVRWVIRIPIITIITNLTEEIY